MKRVYISGHITGTDDYKQRFRAAELELKERKYIPINPAKVNATLPAKYTSHEEYMQISFCLLDMCDAIYMMPNWQQSIGACMEYGYARAKGKTIYLEMPPALERE